MRKSKQKQISRQLGDVQQRIERWRKRGGGRGARMPEELWQAATNVAGNEGVYAVSSVLRLDHSRLKARVASAEDTSASATNESADVAFVEFGTSQIYGGCKTVIELEGRAGDRMRVEIEGKSAVDIAGLAQAFLSQQS